MDVKQDEWTDELFDERAAAAERYAYCLSHPAAVLKKQRAREKRKTALSILTMILVWGLVILLFVSSFTPAGAWYYKVRGDIETHFQTAKLQNADWSIESNPDTLNKMKPQVWAALDATQKEEVVRNIIQIELYYMGVKTDVELVVQDMGGSTLGSYVELLHIIRIDRTHLLEDPVENVVNTICHECRHVYQHTCIDAYTQTDEQYQDLNMFDASKRFLSNALNYYDYDSDIDDQDNYQAYYDQAMEADAFSYAAQATEEYYSELIPEYASEG